MITEFGYVAAIDNWFANNGAVMNYMYNGAGLLLGNVALGVSLSDGSGSHASVILDWINMVLGIADTIATALGQEEVSTVISVLSDSLDVANKIVEGQEGTGNQFEAQVFQVGNKLSDQRNAFTTVNACHNQQYVTDWGLMQTIGKGAPDGKPIIGAPIWLK